MQRLEKYVYNLVKNNAYIKNILVVIYQFVFCFFGLMKGKIVTRNKYIEIRSSFFGFHDRASMNKQGKVLSHVVTGKFVKGLGCADITVTDIHSANTRIIANTKCCNYQQGSLLTWLSDSQVIYNDMNEEGPITLIRDIDTGLTHRLPFHFFSLSPNAKLVSSINFYRFGKGLEGYGYDVKYPENFIKDGKNHLSDNEISDFVIFDIKNEKMVYRLSITTAKEYAVGLIDDGYYYFSHSCFSPSSDKIYFLLRSSNKLYNTSQLFSYDLCKKQLTALPSGGMVSHLSWLSNDRIVAFCNTVDNKLFAYYTFDLTNNSVQHEDITGVNKDGHPHSLNDNTFYTDTYPDKERRQHLYRVNLADNSVETVLSVYSPLRFRGVERVDFHPRLSLCHNYITMDSSHNSDRSQLILVLNNKMIDDEK